MFKQASSSNPTNAILTGKGATHFWEKAAAKGKSKSSAKKWGEKFYLHIL